MVGLTGGEAGALEVGEVGGLTEGGGDGLEVAGLMVGLGGGLVMAGLGLATTGAGSGELGLALDAGALEGSGVTAAPAGDGPATTRTAKGTRKAGVTCDGDAALLLPP